MKGLALHSLIVLPSLVVLALVGWLVLGALPGVTITGDVVAWLAELPILTCFALATLVGAMVSMQITGMNIPNAERLELMRRAANGDRAAYRVLRYESFCWFLMLALSALYFWPAK